MDEGKGSFGKAVNDSALYHDLHETMVSLQRLLDDVQKNPQRYIHVKVF
jgi:phospholipid/cholesterol/gamma-HCH transport system substrate-binding protein